MKSRILDPNFRYVSAAEAYSKMCGQAEEIMHLQQDLKTAIEAYRALLRR